MRSLRGLVAVMASAGAVMAVTPALALDPASPSSAVGNETTGTPLHLRPTAAPLANDENGGLLSTAAKLAILTSLVGGAAWVARRRRPVEFLAEQTSVCILARHTVGVRSEVLVLEAAGEKLLLGVTPAGISLLANLTDPSEATAREMDRKPLENRLDAVLSAGLRDATAKASENSQEYALRRDENRRDEYRRDEIRRDDGDAQNVTGSRSHRPTSRQQTSDDREADASPPPSGRSLRQTSKQTSLEEHEGNDSDEASSRFVAAPKPSRPKSNPSYPDMAEGQVRGLARARAKA